MAKENKFGTFGGVYTPSLLTILGVIMYLRLPWIVGHAGLATAIGIILVAHIISVATGLSISSIATDKNVGAGGPYYIVSRSLGLPIGGALGLTLFVGLCFSASLYIIGFSESLLHTFAIEINTTSIRITGTLVLFVVTAVTVISTAFAIKTQYFVFSMIAASLGAIFFGDPSLALAIPNAPSETPNLALLFGIFFPAVTGFTAGVNMSGDLKDPKRAIPTGTMAAIFSGLFVYLSLAVYLGLRVSPEALKTDPYVLIHIAFKGMGGLGGGLVIAGVWGATFSSGLGSIMGAPRILQALSSDRITPQIFAKGHGPDKEPRNALLLAILLAEAGILIAELNAIARIVSMVFLSMYAFLNICCAIEAKVSPDFRPAFRIPASISVIGAATSIIIMIQLDLPAMLVAAGLMVGLFVTLQRKQLKLESGDAWEGVWSSMIRSALYRVTGASQKQQRNWRPNVLAFRRGGNNDDNYEAFAQALITGNGILTDFVVWRKERSGGVQGIDKYRSKSSEQDSKIQTQPEHAVGIFRKAVATGDDFFDKIQTLCLNYGFSGLEPNTVLLPWTLERFDPEKFAQTVDLAADQDFNILSYQHAESTEINERIDIWWRADSGNVAYCLALLRFLSRSPAWEHSPLRFILLSSESANNDNLRSTMRRLLRDARVEAQVKIENDTFEDRSFVDRVRNLSSDAGLTVIGLPNRSGELDLKRCGELKELCTNLDKVLLVRGSSSFAEVLPVGRTATILEPAPSVEESLQLTELPELTISEVPDIAAATADFLERSQRLVGRLSERSLKKLYGRHIELVRALRASAEQHLRTENSGKSKNQSRLRNIFTRQQNSFLLECQNILDDFTKRDLPDLHSILEGGIDAFLNDDELVGAPGSSLEITRKIEDFAPDEKDTSQIRRFKRRRRVRAWFSRKSPRYEVPVFRLQRFYFQTAIDDLLAPTVKNFMTESHQVLVQIGKLLNSSRITFPVAKEGLALETIFEAQRAQLRGHFDSIDSKTRELLKQRSWSLMVGAHDLTEKFAQDIASFDIFRLIRFERVPQDNHNTEELDAAPEDWKRHQAQLAERARLALSLSSVQHRITAIVSREREALEIGIKNGALAECEHVLAQLSRLRAQLSSGTAPTEKLNLRADAKVLFDPQPIAYRLVQDCGGSTDELPVSLKTLSDESIQALEEGRLDLVDEVELPVRRLIQFLTETELIGGLVDEFSRIPLQEQGALGIAQDVVRLVNFQLSELEATEDLSPEDFIGQVSPVVENGMERLKVALDSLNTRRPALLASVDRRLHQVIDGTNAYELSTQSERLDQHIRSYHGKKAVSGARGLLRKTLSHAKNTTVKLLYRRSEGVLLARQRRGSLRSEERAVDRISELVRSEVPRAEVTRELPFYYRQLFFGQSGINETFWVGRKTQLSKAKQALLQFDAGASGSLLIVGDRLSGKSALLQKIGNDLLQKRKIFRVHAPPGGSIDEESLERALAKAMGGDSANTQETDLRSQLSSLPSNAVIVFDDLNLWWERSPAGLRILALLREAIHTHGGRVLFILALETQSFRFINRLIPLADTALAILECDPLPAESLKSIVTLRHGSTGLKYQLGDRSEAQIGELSLARLFSQHFEHSGGSVGSTLRSWIACIIRVNGDVLEIASPVRRDWEALDTLRDDWVALLLQLALHKQMSLERLQRVSGIPLSSLRADIDALVRMGLVMESQRRVLEIEPALYPALTERFMKRGVFA